MSANVQGTPHLLLLGAESPGELGARLEELHARPENARADNHGAAADNHASAADSHAPAGTWRAALVFTGPDELARRAQTLREWLLAPSDDPRRATSERFLRVERGVFLGSCSELPRIGFLFPGQGAPVHTAPGGMAVLCPDTADPYVTSGLSGLEQVSEDRVQVSVAASSAAALRTVRALGLDAELAIGHSLGELCALHWAGSYSEQTLLHMALVRGRAMTGKAIPPGAMLSVQASTNMVDELIAANLGLCVACHNTPEQWVLSGPREAIEQASINAREAGVRAVRLKVTGAFHSPLMSPAIPIFGSHLAQQRLLAPRRTVLSTVTAGALTKDTDLRELLEVQLTKPVLFVEAMALAAKQVDLFIEVGPGRVLSGMLARWLDVPAVSVRAGEPTASGILEVAGSAYAAGARVDVARLAAAGLATCAAASSAETPSPA